MKVVFIGNVLPEDIFFKVCSISPSTNNVQLNYISYLNRYFKDDLFVYSCNFNVKKLIDSKNNSVTKSFIFETNNRIKIKTVPFSNRRFFLNFSLIKNLKKDLKKLRESFKEESFVFIVNNHFYFHALPVFLSKKKNDKVFTILNEVLDVKYLPAHGKVSLKDSLSNFINFKLLRKNTGIISFSERSILDYKLASIPHIVLIHPAKYDYYSPFNNEDEMNKVFTLFYGGLINEIYDIDNIISSMSFLPERFRLVLCGGGDKILINSIKERIKNDSRINYLGLIEKNKAIQYANQSNLLLMIRKTKSKQEKYIATYSQPSKTVEYLLSGVPILATNIEAIPSSLKEFMRLVDDDSPCALAKEVLLIEQNYSFFREKAKQGKEYASKNCTIESQEKSFISFLLRHIDV